MEQTLGHRILAHRKRLGLTQDQLAEKLGVTAQAVSKWENDQSCPDITILPKLAAIFGITTDILLGSAPEEPVTAAEVTVEDPQGEKKDSTLHISKGGWEFKWDSGRRSVLTIALLVLAVGGQLLAARLLNLDMSFWSITWTSALLVFGFTGLLHYFSFWRLVAMLAGAYFVMDNWQLLPFSLSGDLVFPLAILVFGVSLLLDALKRPKKPRYSVTHKTGNPTGTQEKKTRTCSTEGGFLTFNGSFGDQRQDVVLSLLTGGRIETSFGDFTVDLSGVDSVSSPCHLEAETSFGKLTILVPQKFAVKASTSTDFANVSIYGHPDINPLGVITVEARATFGDIAIRYI